MSDWEEDMYDDDVEEEELSFDEDSGDEHHVDVEMSNCTSFNLESAYFQAKNYKEEGNVSEAITIFSSIISSDQPEYDYKFKSMKQLIKIYEHNKTYSEIKQLLIQLFSIKHHLDNPYVSSSVLKIINRMNPNLNDSNDQLSILRTLHELSDGETNSSFEKIKIKTDLLIAKLMIMKGEQESAQNLLENLELKIHSLSTSTINMYFLEILTSQILLILNHKFDLKGLERLVNETKKIDSGIPQMKILGVKNEALGLVSMYSEDYVSANIHFINAFKNFNDSGDSRRVSVLAKYIITTILSRSEVDPFKSSDFHGFLKIDVIEYLMRVYHTFQNTDIKMFNQLLKSDILQRLSIDFQFLNDFVAPIKELLYTDYIIQYLNLFDRIEFSYFTKNLEIELLAFKKLLLKLYNTGKITDCKFDFIGNHILKKKSTFVTITANQLIDNAFKVFDIRNPNMFDIFKSEYEQLIKKENTDTGDIENIQRKTQSQLNVRRPEAMPRTVSHRLSDFSVFELSQNNLMNLDKSLVNENLGVMKFNTSYNADTLRILSKHLFEANMLKKELSKDTHIRNNLILYINQYIDIAKSSIPIHKHENVSYLNQVNDSKVVSEFNKLFKDNHGDTPSGSDSNIPDVIQKSTMNQLEPPTNPDYRNDTDLNLTQQEKRMERLKLIEQSILLVSSKQLESELRSSNMRPCLQSTLSRTKLKRPTSEMGKFKFNRLQRRGHTFDFSETTSTENMSVDFDDDDDDDDDDDNDDSYD